MGLLLQLDNQHRKSSSHWMVWCFDDSYLVDCNFCIYYRFYCLPRQWILMWEFSFRLGMRPWITVAYSAATAVFLIYPIGQGSFSNGVVGVFSNSLFNAMHGSLVTSSLIRETTENESANEGYKFGQEEETYNIVAAHGYFGQLIFQYASFNNSCSLHFFLAAWPVVGGVILLRGWGSHGYEAFFKGGSTNVGKLCVRLWRHEDEGEGGGGEGGDMGHYAFWVVSRVGYGEEVEGAFASMEGDRPKAYDNAPNLCRIKKARAKVLSKATQPLARVFRITSLQTYYNMSK
ncbi:hypothetical protein VNO78_18518 [Psophocarpus tetragonolobus]|uniref:Uncharacterized protein n=1 Tax=Psophocarpus tetragonolobus TaxID=3891 RepID=A0AAN9XM36_PSOTE